MGVGAYLGIERGERGADALRLGACLFCFLGSGIHGGKTREGGRELRLLPPSRFSVCMSAFNSYYAWTEAWRVSPLLSEGAKPRQGKH